MEIHSSNSLFFKCLYAIGFALLAAWIAIVQSKAFYAVAPFHYDSAYYLFRSLQLYDVYSLYGRLAAIITVIQNDKDFLDLILRILVLPYSLAITYGHMVVVLIFLFFFNLLCLQYSYQRTQSWVLSLVVLGLLYIFPLIYSPVKGIADYWKESVAIFILGCAIIGWLLSDHLNRPIWSFTCSIFLGLLVMQRTALSLYVALIYIPLFSVAVIQRIRQDQLKMALLKVSVWLFPVSIISAAVIYFQWKILFNYYVVKAYDYVTYFAVIKQLAYWVIHDLPNFFPMIVFTILFVIFSYFIIDWKRQSRDILITLWIVVAFPLFIIASRALYGNFYNVWSILIICFFAALLPQYFISYKSRKKFSVLVLMVVILSSILELTFCKIQTIATIQQMHGYRSFYDQVTTLIMSEPSPRHFSFLVSEDYSKLYDHAGFNRGIPLNAMIIEGFMSVHDSYYQLEFKERIRDIESLAESLIKGLQHDHMLIFAYCDQDEVNRSPAFEKDAVSIAIPVVTKQTAYLKRHPEWQVIKKLDSPYGCVYAYRYSSNSLTARLSVIE